MKKLFTTCIMGLAGAFALMQAQTALTASFSAREAAKEIYRQGFDTREGMTDWSVSATNYDYTWDWGTVKNKNIEDFSTIDPTSQYSAAIYYCEDCYQDETLCSPYFLLAKPSLIRLWTAFSGVWAYNGRFTIHAQRKSADTPDLLFDAFMWSQENRHEFHQWLEFEFDLEPYTSATDSVRILFRYESAGGGDDVYIDNFRLFEKADEATATVAIDKGGEVHFTDLSTGEPDGWLWTFEGATPATSTERHPVVRYEQSGTFDVTLQVTKGGASHATTREDFVTVRAVQPVADFGYPAEGYFSPYAGIYVPVGVPVTFTDRSTNYPDSWLWTFEGAFPATSEEQNPTVTYLGQGSYELSLTATNAGGSQTIQSPEGAVQAGGPCSIWNIGSDENANIGAVNLGFYGYYGGSNWLGMAAFAERFHAPATPLTLDAVDIYFANATVIEPAVDLTVKIAAEADSLPGRVLASKTISTDDIAFDPSTWLPTTVTLDGELRLDSAFYVIIEGIPNRTDETTYETDDLVIGAVRRDVDNAIRPGTSYHLLEIWDENDQPTGETQWYANTDDNVSLGIAPHVQLEDAICYDGLPAVDADKPQLQQRGREVAIPSASNARLAIYDLQGRKCLEQHPYNGEAVQLPAQGLYLLRLTQGETTHAYKVGI